LWIKDGNKNIRVEDTFVPKIYVRNENIKELRRKLFLNHIKSDYVKKKNFFGKEILVLEIKVYGLSKYKPLVRFIEKLENYNVEIYNADLQLEEYYMFEKELFPLAKIEFEIKDNTIIKIKNIDDIEDIDYKVPDFSVAKILVKTKDNLFKGFNTTIEKILLNDKAFDEDEKQILEKFKSSFESLDPDIVWIENGNLSIPFLKDRFEHYGINFQFNRFDEDDFEYKEGRFYDTYSRVIYRTHSIFLKGRMHFDTRSFFADDTGYYGILDGARACRIRIQRAEMRSAGACVTNLLMYTAHKNNFLLPYKIGIYERFKTLEQLYNCDRGSLIYEPRVGFHTDVAEFDFVSLYPNIMNKFNLSPETLFCRCCKDNKVPYLHYNYCRKVRGIVPIVSKQLIERRYELKQKKDNISKQKVDFLKWCLVTMFGYQAFKNRKIGIIETHESIQAYAREIMLRTSRIAETHGWEVLHGIIDSIYVKKNEFTDTDIQRLGREIYYQTGMELNHEGNYRWMVFLPSITDENIPVPSHFYGVFEDGEIKCRGIEARRKDVPKIVADMQLKMIETLAPAKSEDEFRALFPKVFKILKNYIKSLPNATVDDLTIIRTLSKTNYINDIAQKIVLQQMKNEGFDVKSGMKIAYIIRGMDNKNPLKRYVSIENFNGKFDINKYAELMIRATFSILQPFGISMEYINKNTKSFVQQKISYYQYEREIVNRGMMAMVEKI
jgi:DNA polymerase elongation subunit (family B)